MLAGPAFPAKGVARDTAKHRERGVEIEKTTMPDEPRISDELKKMEYEPLLPAEKRMIVISLLLGLVLLAGFILASPSPH